MEFLLIRILFRPPWADDILKVGLSIHSKEDVDRQSKMSIPRLEGIEATNGTKEKAKSSDINRGILLFPLF